MTVIERDAGTATTGWENDSTCCHCEEQRDEAISYSRIMDRHYYVYIMTNPTRTVLYTGVTNDLKKRVYQHKEKLVPGFTGRYNLNKLVFYEATPDVTSAIVREKQIKGGSRAKKITLVESLNPAWDDLYDSI
jgi:putative endonuclease